MDREDEPGVELAHYRQHGAGVTLICHCGASKVVGLETVIETLGADFPIRLVWRKARQRCESCGLVAWIGSRPHFGGDEKWRHHP